MPSTAILLLSMLLSEPPVERELSADITLPELKAHVQRLASADFQGRRGAGGARASRHLAELFEHIGLQPPPSPSPLEERGRGEGASYFQGIPWLLAKEGEESFVGRNVVGLLPGSDPQLKDEWILIGAHYDHIGVQNGELHPGADDNASGVAMLLEVAEHLTLSPHKPRRTVCFVAFDLEEAGLQGSTHFATHPPCNIRQIKAVLIADMLGRSMANLMDEYVFVLGSETAPELRTLIQEVAPPAGLQPGRLGTDLIGTRSDYGPFRDRRVPFLFFTTGQHPDYHRPSDTADRIDYAKLQRASRWIADLTRRLADADTPPRWADTPASADIGEVETIRILVERALASPFYPLSEKQRELLQSTRKRLDSIIAKGSISGDDRSWLVWTARLLLLTVF